MRRFLCLVLCLATCAVPLRLAAAERLLPPLIDKYHVTPQERAACASDAVRFCAYAYPDEDALIVCMKANRPQLSNRCVAVLDAGLRRRNL